MKPMISVIIPVHNGGDLFRRCLEALQETLYESWECIVVEDGSTDDTVEIAYSHGMRLVTGLSRRLGPAQARNIGAQVAQGSILFFVDADVLVQPGTVGHVAATMQANPELAACFGSYDDAPFAPNFLSQYRNLLHHYVHQHSKIDASTFWSGCGAIRRDVFLAIGGFNEQLYERPSIEDIELGYRLQAAGHRVQLEKLLQVKHMKRWTPRQMLITDVRDRALPWTRLILQGGGAPNDLNLNFSQRLSTAVTFIGLFALGLTMLSAWAWVFVLLAMVLLIWLNWPFYQFLLESRGVRFLLMALPWHWFYFIYSGATFLAGLVLFRLGRVEQIVVDGIRPLTTPPTNNPQTTAE
ncbi:glycosyltransferase family 2 protein [Candidatus Leptofilum sp.]|uniref:glycosyltransferase family 2 protein n=1 Tax=Candidatus Leptofilum sp. TaxID=3241576 RepID=UPI003B5AC7C8